jgi:hypothetical protein
VPTRTGPEKVENDMIHPQSALAVSEEKSA